MTQTYLETFLKNHGLSRFKTQSLLENLEIEQIEISDDEILGMWSTIVILSNSDFSIMIKGHYNPVHLGLELAKSLGDNPEDQNELIENVHDFSRELISIIAGGLKSEFKKMNFDSGVSLPITTSGLDQFFDRFSTTGKNVEYVYLILSNKHPIYNLDIRLRSSKPEIIKKLTEIKYE